MEGPGISAPQARAEGWRPLFLAGGLIAGLGLVLQGVAFAQVPEDARVGILATGGSAYEPTFGPTTTEWLVVGLGLVVIGWFLWRPLPWGRARAKRASIVLALLAWVALPLGLGFLAIGHAIISLFLTSHMGMLMDRPEFWRDPSWASAFLCFELGYVLQGVGFIAIVGFTSLLPRRFVWFGSRAEKFAMIPMVGGLGLWTVLYATARSRLPMDLPWYSAPSLVPYFEYSAIAFAALAVGFGLSGAMYLMSPAWRRALVPGKSGPLS